uniref:Retrotransposon protein, putative, Ty1-copia subclass n=1 Tax=Tanacetum cinerariifolium TaxID=118510 RepID=A0A6L2KWW5_TANCI|nr:retrotransposon protein, putative, Ty1-copia subclass [Tanacetum cinerariifolium]
MRCKVNCRNKIDKDENLEYLQLFQKEVENQLEKTIKSPRSDREGEYMCQEFLDHRKEHGIIAHRTPPYTPQHNGVSEMRNRTLLDMNAEFFENDVIDHEASGSLEDLEIIQEEDTHPSLDTSLNHEEDDQKIDEPQRELGEPVNYKAALLDPESDKWLNAMNVEMQSMIDNEVWELVDLLPDGKTVGHKWLFKKKIDMDRAVHTYKARLHMENIPYASAVGSIMYVVRCTRLNVAFAQNITKVFCYTDDGYLTDADDIKSQTGYVFILNGGVVDYKSTKQSIFATSSTYAEYIAAFNASKEAVWIYVVSYQYICKPATPNPKLELLEYDINLWKVIQNGNFYYEVEDSETKLMKETLYELLEDDQKKKLCKNNEAKMTLYNALRHKEYDRVFMCKTTKEFSISNKETIDSDFTRFNAIVTSPKYLDPDYSSKNHVRKFLRALSLKWRAKVMAIKDAKDLPTLPLDEPIGNLKVYEIVLDNDADSQDGSDEDVDEEEEEAEAFNLMAKNFRKFFRKGTTVVKARSKKKLAIIAGYNATFLVSVESPRRIRLLLEEHGAIVKITTDTKTTQHDSWKSTLKSALIDPCSRLSFDIKLSMHEIVDSGFPKHMTGNRRLFSSYNAYDGCHVIHGSNLKGKVVGGGYCQTSKAYIVHNKETMRIEKSHNVTFDESLPEPKSSSLVEDDRIDELIVQDLNGSLSLQVKTKQA